MLLLDFKSRFKTIVSGFSALAIMAVVAGAPSDVNATTVTISDGTLAENSTAQLGTGLRTALDASFNIANGPLTFSGTLDPSTNGTVSPSGYNMGITVGQVYFLIHPFFSGGAHRYDVVNLATNFNSPGALTSNINLGFTPGGGATDFLVALTDAGAGNFNADVTITSGSNVSNLATAVIASSFFGTGGNVSSFGVFHIGISGDGVGDLTYSGLTATNSVSVVPIPAALPLFGSGLAVMGFIGWWRKRKINEAA